MKLTNMKLVFEGYLCHSKTREETYGYESLLSKNPPVKRTIQLHWTDETEEQTIPAEWDKVVFSEGDLFNNCENGKRYRVTVEEVSEI